MIMNISYRMIFPWGSRPSTNSRRPVLYLAVSGILFSLGLCVYLYSSNQVSTRRFPSPDREYEWPPVQHVVSRISALVASAGYAVAFGFCLPVFGFIIEHDSSAENVYILFCLLLSMLCYFSLFPVWYLLWKPTRKQLIDGLSCRRDQRGSRDESLDETSLA